MKCKVAIDDACEDEVPLIRYNPFSTMSWMYSISGIEIVPDYSAVRSNWSLGRQVFFISLFWLYLPFSTVWEDLKKPLSVQYLCVLVYLILTCAFQWAHLAKGKERRAFIQRLTIGVTPDLKTRLTWISTAFLLFISIAIALQTSTLFEYWKISLVSSPPLRVLIGVAFGFLECTLYEPSLASMSMYVTSFLLYRNSVWVKTSQLMNSARSADDQAMRHSLEEIQRDNNQFESLFNLNPLVWLIQGFLQQLFTFLFWNASSCSTIIYSFMKIASMMVVFFYLSHVSDEINSWADDILRVYGENVVPRPDLQYQVAASMKKAFKRKNDGLEDIRH